MSRWSILYRGSLSSCNYDCSYCPFAKQTNTRDELRADAAQLHRFVDWVATQNRSIGVLFTPWGEALVRSHYREQLTRLSHLPNVWRVAVQTNLSWGQGWLDGVNQGTFALWNTWHPTQTPLDAFVERCRRLDERDIRYSVGVVGLREHFDGIEALRRALPKQVYLWVNAYKRDPDYYSGAHRRRLTAIDPLFAVNNRYHRSLGRACKAGATTFSVDGDGNVTRCHFIKQRLGNIYASPVDQYLSASPSACTNATCGCHIGYVHLEPLNLHATFGDGILERIPLASALESPHASF
jgi:MoaA/NifB/PqqE/SkfB family radical SAM enzyme